VAGGLWATRRPLAAVPTMTTHCGFLAPHGVYTAPHDWNHAIISQLIVARRLAPFYPSLEEYDPFWDDS